MKIPWNLFRGRGKSARPAHGLYRPVIEILEDRLVLSTFTGPVQANPATDWRDMTFTISDQMTTASTTPSTGTVSAQSMEDSSLIGLNQTFASYPYRGAGYTVAVIDTGIDYNNPALGGGWGKRVVAGWNFVSNNSNPMDDNGHGTFVAGIIGSSNANYMGIAPDVDFVALKVLDSTGTGTYGNVDLALQWVAAHQAQYNIVAVNLSLGSGDYMSEPYTFLDNDFQTLVKDGVFIAVAAGNDYYTYGSEQGLAFPAVSPYVVSVGAVWDGNYGSVTWVNGAEDYTTAPGLITSFTERDANLDILAPGAMITSTSLNDQFTSMAGTSMSTPVVAGAAVLIHEALDALGKDSLATQQNILDIMQQTGTPVVDNDPSHDNVVNTGMTFESLNLYAALNSVESGATPGSPVSQPPVLGTLSNVTMTAGQSQTITLSASGSAVQFSAQAVGMASQDYQLRQQYGLTYAGNYYYDSWGEDEKWLLGTGGQWFLLTPDGDLREFTGSITTSMLPAAVVANVGVAVYNNPSLLWNAAPSTAPPVTVSVSGNQLEITAPSSYTGTFQVTVTASSGGLSSTGTFQVTVNAAPVGPVAPAFTNLNNVTLSSSAGTGTIALSATGPTGVPLTYSAALASASAQAVTLQKSLGFYYLGGYFQNLDGENEKWLGGAGGKLYIILPDGELRNYSSTITAALTPQALVATLTPSFYANPQLLLSPVQPTFKVAGSQLTISYPVGYLGSFLVQVNVAAGSVVTSQTITVSVASTTSGTSLAMQSAFTPGVSSLTPNESSAWERPLISSIFMDTTLPSVVSATPSKPADPSISTDADWAIWELPSSNLEVDGVAQWLEDNAV